MPLLFWILTLIVVVWGPVEEILFRTQHETLQKIYNLPQFGTTLEFLTMLALSSGKLHKVRLSPPPLSHYLPANNFEICEGRNARHLSGSPSGPNGLESPENPLFLRPAFNTSFFNTLRCTQYEHNRGSNCTWCRECGTGPDPWRIR